MRHASPVRFVAALIVMLSSAAAAAQSQPKLEVSSRQGDFYWVVETAADGSRRGGWVSVQVPLDRIDRASFKPLPPLQAQETSLQPPAPPSVDERLARIEQALTQGAKPASSSAPQSRPTVASPRQPGSNALVRAQSRQGFWFNGGLGVGAAGCVGCVGRQVGTSGGLSLGGTLSDRVLLGVGTTGWYKSIDGVSVSGGTFDARLRFYPSLASGFFVTGGGGLGSISVWNAFDSASETGAGVLLGLGWDIRVGRNVSVTPFYNGFAVGVASGTYYVDQFGLGITIH